ncbi:Universal stress protein [Streptomyces sp. RB17]|uniref:universal stress protein n=1 Tax=Streptomyces sp. RB17 TaxID=2585197 RepID=UPI0012965595|nr:universal stress protein [Streptomyces sp. RB17]MQY36609.1 Universal stress protein [Streptomyces sp. RB17]
MRPPLVVGVDGSDSGLPAVDWAADEAEMHGLPLRLVHASRWERYEGRPASTGSARPARRMTAYDIVGDTAEHARRRAPAVPVDTAVLPQGPAYALLHEGHNATALIVGCRGRGELPDTAGIAGTHGRGVIGVGEPGTSGMATRFAFREAEARKCGLDVVRTWRRPPHRSVLTGRAGLGDDEQAVALIDELLEEPLTDHPDAHVLRSVVEGPAREVLLQRSAAADLLVVGVARRRSLGVLELGRVAHTVLHHARCPVAVVPDFP